MIIYPELASSVPECRHILTKRKKSKIFFNFLSEAGELDQANNWVKIVIFFFLWFIFNLRQLLNLVHPWPHKEMNQQNGGGSTQMEVSSWDGEKGVV